MLHFKYKQYKHAQAAIFVFVAVVVLSVQNRKIRISSWGLTFIFLYGSRGQLVQHQTADSHIFSLVLITSAKTVEMQSWKTNNIMARLQNPSLTSKDRTNMLIKTEVKNLTYDFDLMKTERQTYLPISVWDKLPIFTQLTLKKQPTKLNLKWWLQDPDYTPFILLILLYSSSTNC